MQMDEEGENLNIVAKYDILDKNVTFIQDIVWPNGDPSDTPACGFDMSKCPCNLFSLKSVRIVCLIAFCLQPHWTQILLLSSYAL